VVQAILDGVRLLGHILALLSLGNGGGLLLQALLLLSLVLRSIFVQELECLGGLVAVEDILELGNSWGDFEATSKC
jgi:hypothetical protein